MDQQFGQEEEKGEPAGQAERPPAKENKGKLAPVG